MRKRDSSGVSTELRHINHCSIPDSAVQVPPLLNDLKHECAFEWVCVCDREWSELSKKYHRKKRTFTLMSLAMSTHHFITKVLC